VVRTLFNAILSGIVQKNILKINLLYFLFFIAKKIGKKTDINIGSVNDGPEIARRLHENRLIDLAFDWNYIDGAKSILQRWQDTLANNKLNLLDVIVKL
jgi:hypothetical protein